MKTKFSQLVKVKKREVDEIESKLAELQSNKRYVEEEIRDILDNIKDIDKPKSGDFSQLNMAYSYLQHLSNQKKSKEIELKELEWKIKEVKELYKKVNIEFEKVKYLHQEELKREQLKARVKENKDMDEIANLLQLRNKIEV